MNHLTIKKLQKENGFWGYQEAINNGSAWHMEGSYGRLCMELLTSGECMLPRYIKHDYYGNRIPSRTELKSGTKGTYLNCKKYWSQFEGRGGKND